MPGERRSGAGGGLFHAPGQAPHTAQLQRRILQSTIICFFVVLVVGLVAEPRWSLGWAVELAGRAVGIAGTPLGQLARATAL